MDKRVILALALAAPLVAGCTPLTAAVGETVLNGARHEMVQGELRAVNTRQSRLEVRDGAGRTHALRYDRNTQVIHRQRAHPVSYLERGDQVRVRVERDRNGTRWADRVEVREAARQARTERVEGRVGTVSARHGTFTLERSRTATLTVRTPPRMSSADARRFDRLRRGDRVRVEVRQLGRNQAELVRFR